MENRPELGSRVGKYISYKRVTLWPVVPGFVTLKSGNSSLRVPCCSKELHASTAVPFMYTDGCCDKEGGLWKAYGRGEGGIG